MTQDVTEEFVVAAFRGEPEAVAQLVTIRADSLEEPLRVTDWPQGLVSNGEPFDHFPFELRWAGASRETPNGEGQLTIANVDRRIEEACDAALKPVGIDLEIVRINAPDEVEKAIRDARIPSVSGDSQKVQAVIRPRSFAREPAQAFSYLPSTTPGQF